MTTIETIIRLALDAHSLHEMDRKMVQAAQLHARAGKGRAAARRGAAHAD